MVEAIIIVGGVWLALFLGVVLLAELGIRRPVARIAAMARRLSAGDLAARVPPPHPRGELGGLMAELNATAASLERQRDDIGDLNRKLNQAQKMEAVGHLTGGMAHDFNNLLTVIIGNAEHLAESLRDKPDLKRLAEITLTAGERGADLTRSLLAFARRQPLDPKDIDLNRQLRGMEGLLRRTLGEHIECRFQFGAGVWPAKADPGQLETAILNLAINARDAMPQGGALTIETANIKLDAPAAAQIEELREGDYVVIAVSDTGTGMPPEVIARAFEPFFTTKDVGKGSGLGLSMVYGFAKQSRGHVKIYSEPGHGTSVKLYLPRAEAEAAAAAPAAAAAGAAAAQGETILAVEDDELVRAYVVGELRQLGYAVVAARDAAAALELLRGPQPVDLLFTDVVMPGGMSGPKLAAAALVLRPGLKVLYTSGYTENTVIHHGRLDPGVQLLSKPYGRAALAAKLREVLGGRP